MSRKIIQISGESIPGDTQNEHWFNLTALCDDGTLWEFYGLTPAWRRLPSVPQDETEVAKNEH